MCVGSPSVDFKGQLNCKKACGGIFAKRRSLRRFSSRPRVMNDLSLKLPATSPATGDTIHHGLTPIFYPVEHDQTSKNLSDKADTACTLCCDCHLFTASAIWRIYSLSTTPNIWPFSTSVDFLAIPIISNLVAEPLLINPNTSSQHNSISFTQPFVTHFDTKLSTASRGRRCERSSAGREYFGGESGRRE